MGRGILFIKNANQELYLPIFHEDKEFVYSVLTDAMNRWEPRERRSSSSDHVDFYEIADAMGRKMTKSHIFLGPESIPSFINDASYVFAVDFEKRRIWDPK